MRPAQNKLSAALSEARRLFFHTVGCFLEVGSVLDRLSASLDSVNSSCILSLVRNIRLIVPRAKTLEAFVSSAGAATKVRAANGFCVREFGSINGKDSD